MKQLTLEDAKRLDEYQKAIANINSNLRNLSENWHIAKGELTKIEVNITEQQSILAILRQRIAEIDSHHGLEPKGESDGLS